VLQPLERTAAIQSRTESAKRIPARAGLGGSVGDTARSQNLRSHHRIKVEALCSRSECVVPGRLDDRWQYTVEMSGGAKGPLLCSQIGPAGGEKKNPGGLSSAFM